MSYEYNPKSNVVFGNVDLSDYNAYAVYCNIFDRPERDISVVSVPGRNGDLIFDNGRYKNVDRTYQIHVVGVENVHNLIRDLTSTIGYQRLEDEYDPNVYMMARLKSKPNVRKFVGNAVMLTVTFDRMPQRWDKNERMATSGEHYGLYYNDEGYVGNPYVYFSEITINDLQTLYPTVHILENSASSSRGSLYEFDVFQSKTPISDIFTKDSSKYMRADRFYTGEYHSHNPIRDVFLFQITLWCGTESWEVGESILDITIDSEQKIVFKGDKNINATITDYVNFPQFTKGDNYLYMIVTNSGRFSFEVNARKWTI